MLLVEDVHAKYGQVEVLRGISLKVDEGEFVALIGPNGHGKSTTLRTISGLLKPSSGAITLSGENIAGLAADQIARRGVIHVLEGARLFPQMTVKENLLLGAYDVSSWKNRQRSLERVYSLFPVLKERSKQLASSLSGGERQMVAMGRGLVANVRVLMIDEPSLGLAPKLVDEVYSKIGEIKKTGVSILLVEQHPERIVDLADHVYLVENGAIRMQGESKEVIDSQYVRESYLGL
ncbi:MAG: ABC transporter ATP-binding protein [Candidatus Bathyarchaeia archaeon]